MKRILEDKNNNIMKNTLTEKIIEKLLSIKEEVNNEMYGRGIDQAIHQIEKFEKEATFEDVSRIVMKHMGDGKRYHPHHTAIITNSSSELTEGVSAFTDDQYVPDQYVPD